MKHTRLAGFGILAILLITALFVACSSDDDAPQDQEQQEQQQDQQQDQQQSESSTATSRTDEQSESRETTSQSTSAQEEDDQQQTAQQRGEQQSVGDEDSQDDGAQGQATVSSTGEKDEDDEGEKDSAQSDAGEKQPQEESTQGSDQQQQSDSGAENEDLQADDEQDEPVEQQEAEEERQVESSGESEQAAEPQEQEPTEDDRLRLRAEEISAQATTAELTGLNGWLNGDETSIALELAKGNIVLIDFWTYTCINCIRTLPFLTEWDRKYRDHGLVIIGVHTPEFAFEERIENVRAANAEHNIEYLVAIDNDYRTWRAFQNRWWPRKFLIGPTDDSPMGIRYDHIGEGHYQETERAIREALEAVGKDLSDVPFGVSAPVPTREGGTPRQTRELYMGWQRNVGSGGPYAGQDAYFLTGTGIDTLYFDVDTSEREHNFWYLEGLWRIEDEAIVHARTTDDLEDYVALLIRGRTANVVLTVAEDGEPFRVYVELDGRWLFPNEAGSHILWDDEGRSYIRVTENDLYRLVFLPEWSEHELKLRSDSDQFRMFAFTFGSYVGGE
ncbi:MAG: redoxin domain-containing protein [Chloroflexi bacterium]|nr:redoxin domain-containing protein [Chloroflexota bacterium]